MEFSPSGDQLVALNNAGVDCISQNRFNEATAYFNEALKLTKTLLTQHEHAATEQQDAPHRCNQHCNSLESCALPIQVPPSTRGSSTSDRDVWLSDSKTPDGNAFLVYCTPQVLQYGQDKSIRSLNYVSAMILFNLALAHHLKALSLPLSQAAYTTAAKLYEHTYRVAEQESRVGNLILLAILNNLAHIHLRMECRDDAERLCGILWSVVVEAAECESQRPEGALLIEGLYTNVIHVTVRHSQSAAAA